MYICVVLCIVCFVTFSGFFVCICVLYYCHRVATQLQLNISYTHTRVYLDSIQACIGPSGKQYCKCYSSNNRTGLEDANETSPQGDQRLHVQ
jgi:hypothetical protein